MISNSYWLNILFCITGVVLTLSFDTLIVSSNFNHTSPSAKNIKDYIDWIKDIAKGSALATRTTSKVLNLGGIHDCLANNTLAERTYGHMKDRYFPVTWTEEEQEFAKKIQKEMGKPETGMATGMFPMSQGEEVGGSSDVGTVTRMVPTMGVLYAAWPQGVSPHQWGCTACVGTEIGVKASIQVAKTMAAVGYDVLTDASFVQEFQKEFEDRIANDPFVSLCESNKNPAGAVSADVRHVHECCIHGAMKAFGIEEDGH